MASRQRKTSALFKILTEGESAKDLQIRRISELMERNKAMEQQIRSTLNFVAERNNDPKILKMSFLRDKADATDLKYDKNESEITRQYEKEQLDRYIEEQKQKRRKRTNVEGGRPTSYDKHCMEIRGGDGAADRLYNSHISQPIADIQLYRDKYKDWEVDSIPRLNDLESYPMHKSNISPIKKERGRVYENKEGIDNMVNMDNMGDDRENIDNIENKDNMENENKRRIQEILNKQAIEDLKVSKEYAPTNIERIPGDINYEETEEIINRDNRDNNIDIEMEMEIERETRNERRPMPPIPSTHDHPEYSSPILQTQSTRAIQRKLEKQFDIMSGAEKSALLDVQIEAVMGEYEHSVDITEEELNALQMKELNKHINTLCHENDKLSAEIQRLGNKENAAEFFCNQNSLAILSSIGHNKEKYLGSEEKLRRSAQTKAKALIKQVITENTEDSFFTFDDDPTWNAQFPPKPLDNELEIQTDNHRHVTNQIIRDSSDFQKEWDDVCSEPSRKRLIYAQKDYQLDIDLNARMNDKAEEIAIEPFTTSTNEFNGATQRKNWRQNFNKIEEKQTEILSHTPQPKTLDVEVRSRNITTPYTDSKASFGGVSTGSYSSTTAALQYDILKERQIRDDREWEQADHIKTKFALRLGLPNTQSYQKEEEKEIFESSKSKDVDFGKPLGKLQYRAIGNTQPPPLRPSTPLGNKLRGSVIRIPKPAPSPSPAKSMNVSPKKGLEFPESNRMKPSLIGSKKSGGQYENMGGMSFLKSSSKKRRKALPPLSPKPKEAVRAPSPSPPPPHPPKPVEPMAYAAEVQRSFDRTHNPKNGANGFKEIGNQLETIIRQYKARQKTDETNYAMSPKPTNKLKPTNPNAHKLQTKFEHSFDKVWDSTFKEKRKESQFALN